MVLLNYYNVKNRYSLFYINIMLVNIVEFYTRSHVYQFLDVLLHFVGNCDMFWKYVFCIL